jgi:hypothetical protein
VGKCEFQGPAGGRAVTAIENPRPSLPRPLTSPCHCRLRFSISCPVRRTSPSWSSKVCVLDGRTLGFTPSFDLGARPGRRARVKPKKLKLLPRVRSTSLWEKTLNSRSLFNNRGIPHPAGHRGCHSSQAWTHVTRVRVRDGGLNPGDPRTRSDGTRCRRSSRTTERRTGGARAARTRPISAQAEEVDVRSAAQRQGCVARCGCTMSASRSTATVE